MSVIVSPSLLAADFMNLGKDVEMVDRSKADWIHLDIMDGVFVPNISYGLPVVSQIKKIARKPLDVHLMIVQPERYIEAFHKAGADILTVHLEASTHLHRTLQQIKALGMKAGVALNPHTPVSLLEDIIQDIDVVLIMSVNPKVWQGFSPEDQKLLLDCAKETETYGKALSRLGMDGGASLAFLQSIGRVPEVSDPYAFMKEQGMTVTELNHDQIALFHEATKSVRDAWIPKIGADLVKAAEADMAAVK